MIDKYKQHTNSFPVFTSAIAASHKPHLPFIPTIGIHINKAKLKLKVGQTENLTATILPIAATNRTVNWETNHCDIIEIQRKNDTVLITGKRAGKAAVIATTDDGKFRDLCIVTVHEYLTTNK
ncbi:MAG: Ig domain-containing protein [Ectobacillus sp.]